MDNPSSFISAVLRYLNIDNLSENTKNYIEKLCMAIIAWITKCIKEKPTPDVICDILVTILGLEVATPYISRVKDRATKFDEYYADRTKHTEVFLQEGAILVIDIEQIFHTYYFGGSLDVFQCLIAILHQLLDELRSLLIEKPHSSNEEIINYLLLNVPNKEAIISNIESILIPTPVDTSNFVPLTQETVLKLFYDLKEKGDKQ